MSGIYKAIVSVVLLTVLTKLRFPAALTVLSKEVKIELPTFSIVFGTTVFSNDPAALMPRVLDTVARVSLVPVQFGSKTA